MKKAFFKFIKRTFVFSFQIFIYCCNPIQNEFWTTKITKEFWNKKDPLFLKFSANETNNYFISFILTHDYTYSYKNLFLYMEVYQLENLIQKKYLEYKLQNSSNRWVSKGLGALKRIKLKGGKIEFKKGNIYKILIFHNMEKKNLKAIKEISILIKPTLN